MESPRIFCCPITEYDIELTGAEARHLTASLRIETGQVIELFDGAGAWARATVTHITKNRISLDVQQVFHEPPRSRCRITIAAAIAKADRFDWLIGKCTELGVDRICPLRFERTVKLAQGTKIIKRYQNLAIAAAKQCRRWHLPQIDPPCSLPECLSTIEQDYPHRRIMFGSLNPQAVPLINLAFDDSDVITFIGPEGGLTDQETDLLRQNNAQAIRLTDTTLRIETAALACAAILSAQRYSADGK
ncbi:MAG: 16S rRNA (uracil(1498)-N(3))-methyltransferase [Planctomycetes bacterium]|nr:16S rRNA (uracil(1498)-N(3))-methyltransferase [Planctomycetota bacterium]